MSRPPPSLPLPPPGSGCHEQPALSDEQRMLVDLRDVLYEGSWEDFRADLKARRECRPHVFDTIPPSDRTRAIVDRHLRVIDGLEHWERHYCRTLRGSA